MDSRLKRMGILFAVLMMSLVVGVVLLVNYSRKPRRRPRQDSAQESVAKAEEDLTKVDHDLVEKYQLNPARDPYAFLQDETFFVSENTKGEEETESASALSLLASTIMKDLRIFVVDGSGAIVTGQDFEVKVSGSGGKDERVLKDSDTDGILYTDGLSAGEYEVVLEQREGYSVPFDPLKITISDQISYTALHDISFLIHDESSVDAEKEDTAVREAESDADGTETNVRLQDGVSIFGIDVSKWNKQIDWQKVKAAGVDFAIIRCGYRGSGSGYLIEDPRFEENIKNATEAGVNVGVYFFTQAKTPAEGVEEASMVLSLCKEYKLAFPMYIDTEGAGGNGRADGLGVAERTAAVKAFCETIENAGYTAGVYASKYWLLKNLNMEELGGYSIWLAQYSSKASYNGAYDMWQYTSAGRIDGIDTLVDYDLSYVDFVTGKKSEPGLREAAGEGDANPEGQQNPEAQQNPDGEQNPDGQQNPEETPQ
ncbi:MAG: glycoside hydrolase family 25 protein [Lachnospiraceae bacterium]|nr:glycoside hydrolase family 25 protein [Lachnospiraceae bacterium]